MKYARVFTAILKKDLKYQWRYRVNTLFGIAFMTFLCFAIIYVINLFSGDKMGATSRMMVIGGYILWVIMMNNHITITSTISSEATLGTLEQLYINTSNIYLYLIMKCLSTFMVSVISLYGIVISIFIASGLPLEMGILEMLPVVILGIPALWGISLAIGSLALVFKKIESVTSVVSMVIISTIPVIVLKSTVAGIVLPFGMANKISQEIIRGDLSLTDVRAGDLAIIVANDLFYLIIGMGLYAISEYYAKKYGKLAHH